MISEALAQTAATGAASDGTTSILIMLGLFVMMWFLLIRPQNKRMKQHQELVEGLRRGDNVVTEGGLCARITKVIDESYVELEIAEGVKVKHVRNAISVVLNKTEVKEEDATAAKKKSSKK